MSIDKSEKKALKAEAAKLGVSYEELKEKLKAEKKAEKKAAKKRRSREVSALLKGDDRVESEKRMRSWSKELEKEAEAGHVKRMRTRSLDLAESEALKKQAPPGHDLRQSADDWRKEENITVKIQNKPVPEPYRKFSDSPFSDSTRKTILSAKYERPTPIQGQCWPIALQCRDMICIAKTGSGKTLGFLLPCFHLHCKNPKRRGGIPALLVLAPTRELAVQILEQAQLFGQGLGIRSVCCYGGASRVPQMTMLKRGAECIIATPGRLIDFIKDGHANLSRVEFLVLDEADRMLDMGFEPQIREIVKSVPKQRQTLLFSATWPKEIQNLAHDFLTDPVQINVGEVDALVANRDITQNIVLVTHMDKMQKFMDILNKLLHNPHHQNASHGKNHDKTLVFVRTKLTCHDLANKLWDDGFAVDALHGDRQQWERTKVMNAYKAGTLKMLVATDVAARGLDVKDIAVVINYDMAATVEDYVHRIGRTGRAGAKGTAYTLFDASVDKGCANGLLHVLEKAKQHIPQQLIQLGRPFQRTPFARGPRFTGRGGRGRGGRTYMGRGGARTY